MVGGVLCALDVENLFAGEHLTGLGGQHDFFAGSWALSCGGRQVAPVSNNKESRKDVFFIDCFFEESRRGYRNSRFTF